MAKWGIIRKNTQIHYLRSVITLELQMSPELILGMAAIEG